MVPEPSTMTAQDALLICVVISCVFLWLIVGAVAFHWFLRRSVERWVRKGYGFFVEDDDAKKKRAWVVEKVEDVRGKIVNMRSER